MDKKTRRAAKSAKPLKIIDFLQAAFDDYIAARVLIRAGLLPQGAILASTAIEKYCKTVLAFQGQSSPGHLKTAHWNCLRGFDPKLYKTFNEEFFIFLQKCYTLRYPDALLAVFNVVIKSRELLAELDFVALSLQQKFKIVDTSKKEPRQMRHEELITNKDEKLVGENHFLNGEDRAVFIARDNQLVYELRKLDGGSFLNVSYTTPPAASDGKFMREGLKPKDDKRTFEMVSAQGMEKMAEAICENCGKNWKECIALKEDKLTFLDQAPAAGFGINYDKSTGELVNIIFSICIDCEPEKIAEVRRNAKKLTGS